jgi:hypothetical protein
MEYCSDCRFWSGEPNSSGGYVGTSECRRYAPNQTSKGRTNWGETSCDDWCGEFEATPPPDPNIVAHLMGYVPVLPESEDRIDRMMGCYIEIMSEERSREYVCFRKGEAD